MIEIALEFLWLALDYIFVEQKYELKLSAITMH